MFTTCQFFQDQFNFLLFTLHLFVPTNIQRFCEGALPLRSRQTISGSKAFEFWCLSTLGGNSHHPIPLLSQHPEWFDIVTGTNHMKSMQFGCVIWWKHSQIQHSWTHSDSHNTTIWSISRTASFGLFGALPCFLALLVSQDGFRYEALQGGMGRIVPTGLWELPGILWAWQRPVAELDRQRWRVCHVPKGLMSERSRWFVEPRAHLLFTSHLDGVKVRLSDDGLQDGRTTAKGRVSMLHLKILRLLAKPS